MTLPVHPLEQSPYTIQVEEEQEESTSVPDMSSSLTNTAPTPSSSPPPSRTHHQQRAYSVTAMPSELQKSVLRHQEAEHQENMRHNQPWWQYYYQLYHYHLPPGRKPTVFGPYLLLQTMGEGEFGKVKFGIEVKTGQEVAIKLIRKDSIDSSSRMTKVEREISVLRILHHPNIVELFDVIETEKYIGIILQCATGGELFDYILAHRYLKERDASRLFAQLISGVHYMHQKHIVHRDLKLENLLLDRHRNVLITDFGFANQFSSPQDDLMSTSCGSPCYAAPELVMNQGVYVGPAVDIWSCGVILFAMLCGYLPYDDDPANPESYNINLLYKYILNTPLIFPDYISDEACDLLSLMLVPDPEKRCSMDTIMAHPWLSLHKHLFVNIEQQQQQQQEEQNSTMEEDPVREQMTRRNTVDPILHISKHQDDEAVMTTTQEQTQEDEAVVPEIQDINKQQEDQVMEDKKEEQDQITPIEEAIVVKNQDDTTMQEITTIELPPPTLIEDDDNETITKKEQENNNNKDDTLMTEKEQQTQQQQEEQAEKDEELHSVSPLPNTSTTSMSGKIRPKSTVSSSTEKVLHFLSGHSNTPKPVQRNTNEKRTRHMSLATVVDDVPSTSILQAKFLSSIHQRSKNNNTPELSSPTPNTSASTPHPTGGNNKRNFRLSTTNTPPPPPPPVRGTRKKTLSLLVNSMTDNKMPFTNRRQSTTTAPSEPNTATKVHMMPSVSEHTINTFSDKEKHRSAGKKLMDWFKKKPLSTIHRSTNQPSDTMLHNHHDRLVTHNSEFSTSSSAAAADASIHHDPKLRTHHGAVDQEALTSRPPAEVFAQVKQTLKSLGLEFKRDGGEYKLKCARPKKPVVTSSSSRKSTLQHQNQIQQQHGNNTNTPFRMLLRRSSAHAAEEKPTTNTTIYGDPNVDPGEEVRFSVELCKIKNLPGLYIVDMRRMRGNVWAYKFIYRTLLDTLNLGGKSGYLNTTTTKDQQQPQPNESVSTEEDTSNHRMSTASSGDGSSSVLLDDSTPPPPPPPIPTTVEKEEIAAV